MGLDFGKSSMGNPAQAGNGLQEKNEIEVVEKYDVSAMLQMVTGFGLLGHGAEMATASKCVSILM